MTKRMLAIFDDGGLWHVASTTTALVNGTFFFRLFFFSDLLLFFPSFFNFGFGEFGGCTQGLMGVGR